ncbi:hypothetical protein GCM10029976_077520 [Kribbella albertanoniae]
MRLQRAAGDAEICANRCRDLNPAGLQEPAQIRSQAAHPQRFGLVPAVRGEAELPGEPAPVPVQLC